MSETAIDLRRRAYQQRCSEMVSLFMEDVFATTPYPWQLNVITHLLTMNIPGSGIDSGPVLLVRPTGGGKSSVRDVYSVINGGISLTITPLLALGADQDEKITSKAKQTSGTVASVHLDELRSKSDQQELVDMIKALPEDSHTTVLLFSSPQAILNKSFLWLELIDWLIANGRLSMVCVDEVHLFVHFGMTFREEFKALTPALFSKLKVRCCNTRSTIPILFMTATCTKSIVETVERIVGFMFDKDSNVFWPQPDEMQHRQVLLDVQYSTQALHVFKKRTRNLLKHSSLEKYILYSNTRATVDRVSPKLCEWIDANGFKSDLLKIVGTLLREQKFYHIRVFCRSLRGNKLVFDEGCREDKRPFNPQILVATSGAANAGIDDPEVHGVCRLEFPPSIIDVNQEKGRAGRRSHAKPSSDWYLLCFSLESYVVLLKRLHDTPAANKQIPYFKTQEADMQDCLTAFILPQHCQQAWMEVKQSNPYVPLSRHPVACLDACAYCLGRYKTMFPTLIRSGVQTVFLQLYFGEHPMKNRPTIDKELVDAIKSYPGSNRLLFGINSNKKPEPVLIKKMIMMLLAAKILRYVTERKESTPPGKFTMSVFGSLAFVSGNATKLALNDPSYWTLLPLKD
jgi:superfamily II DNA helicase RecQ